MSAGHFIITVLY